VGRKEDSGENNTAEDAGKDDNEHAAVREINAAAYHGGRGRNDWSIECTLEGDLFEGCAVTMEG
jgi:hypothetical protein